jgi:hypothetical protein
VRAFDLRQALDGVLLGTLRVPVVPFHLGVERISDSVFDRLMELCNVGLPRTVDEGRPSRRLRLTDAGALLPALEQITRWAQQHLP